MDLTKVLRFAAFTDNPGGGNPAGIVINRQLPESVEMLRIAAAVGYSETIFLAGDGAHNWRARYFSPEAEVPFCGHATVAAAVALEERYHLGHYEFDTAVGAIPVSIEHGEGTPKAVLTSVEPHVEDIDPDVRRHLLRCFGWTDDDLDPDLPLRVAYAGARHPVIALRSREALTAMVYDFDRLRDLMLVNDFTTVQVVWRDGPSTFWARDPFPVGGVVEDPATGAAAAALGGYLRALGLVETPTTLTIHQGDDLGRPSLITVGIGTHGGITVAGQAVALRS